MEGERKIVTALFADIKGSTELMEDLDPEEARAIVDPALKLMIDAVRRYGGYVVQSTGDGIFAIFGAPVANEDHPQRALYAALRIQDDLRRHSDRVRAGGGPPIQARVGVNTGEVVVRSIATGAGKIEYTPIGHTTNLAARMQTLAPIGSIAAAEATHKLCEGYFTFRALGPAKVKGVSEPVNVYEATGLGPLRTRLQRSASRGYTRFVGREREMLELERAAAEAKAGHGQIVAVMADAGVGKSRLFYEFGAKYQSEWMILRGLSLSHGKATAYLPVLELLQSYFRIASDDDLRTRREKVAGRITILDRALEDVLPYLFGLLGLTQGEDRLAGMDAQIRRQRTLDALKRILLRESRNQPLMLVFEDLHWIDEETEALLDLLAESIENSPILLLVNYRPEFSHGWGSRTYYTQLRLDPLGRESADELLDALLGVGAQVADQPLGALKRLIIEKTEGNPLFIEEIVQALFEEGTLVLDGLIHLTKPLAELKIPPTVQAILASRIDRLPALEKELLQTLAVLGPQFSLSLAREVWRQKREAVPPQPQLEPMLSDLQLAEFIYEQPAPGDVEYAFKHALTREVAYSSLLMERRRLLHERAARALEALTADRSDDHLASIAHHYSRSENNPKAVDYLIRAGYQALQRSTAAGARSYFDDAFARLEKLPQNLERDRKELAIQTCLADVSIITSGYAAPEYERKLIRRSELAERLGNAEQIFYSLVGMSVLSTFRLELKKAREIGDRLLALAEQAHDPKMQLEAHGSLANILWVCGDFPGSREHSLKGLTLFPLNQNLPFGEEHQRAACLLYAAFCEFMLGFPEKALGRALEFLAWAREREQPLSVAFALNCVSTILNWRREGGEALKYDDALLVLATEQGFSNWHSFAQINRGHALALLGRGHEALAEIKCAIASFEASGAVVPGWMRCTLAAGYQAADQPAEGLTVVTGALDLADRTGSGEATAELYRLKGELLLACEPTAVEEAETSFRAAINTACAQQAKLPELRATSSLARLLAHSGRCQEARTLLSEIYNWFTEGFDSANLKDAKALLDELNE